MGPLIMPPSNTGQPSKCMSARARVLLIPLLMLLVLAGVIGKPIFGFLYYESGVEGYLHQAHFDSKGWQTNVLDGNPNWPTRLRMVDDLLNRHLLDGRSRKEVELLLGPRSQTDYFPDLGLGLLAWA